MSASLPTGQHGRIAVVTGASRGLGQAVALGLAERGDRVVAVAVLRLTSEAGGATNGEFCWIDDPLQAPIASWDPPLVDERPWLDA